MREKQMNEFFKQKNESLNGNKTKEGDMYLSKRDIINEIEKREKGENETKKESINLSSVFSSMKVKSKDSDIIAARQQTDVIDLNQRVDKLEQYLSDIIINQLKIMEMISNHEEKNDNWKGKNNEIAREVEYVIEESKTNDVVDDNIVNDSIVDESI
jgi:hypothetical protein